MTEEKGILLQSGTNELEIVTFTVGENLFCINVLKVKEIIHPLEVTPVPDSNPAIEGVSQVRGEIMPVVNLARVMKLPEIEPENTKFIITELNQMKIVFRVDEVHRIQRISWEQIEEPEKLSIGLEELAVGIVKLDGNLVLLLDYEKIIYEISGNADFAVTGEDRIARKVNREEKTIFIAEDSQMLRQLLEDTLHEAGYTNLQFFANGREAQEHIFKLLKEQKEQTFENVNLLITDIEMPQMDGHHLTKVIKEDEIGRELPVVIFSSLITEDLEHKGAGVGADAQVSKPNIHQLINILDELVL
ncbi:chemotaxis protein CheV [Listeria monocytogenes]|jgi:Chemotaxis signal transduction protein|uniref:Lmo0689 protein n=11 Tax=Listeria TaxID=1637 RepID=Q8Y948_LISMO|nr:MULTISPECIES: chemotaxis protein [Listeria]NP_464216.1 chemotaxis protein CheV [Listeria monocytogenes EGD-e]EAA0164598.1 chemotaxis protein CheV [Listeria monocytogenes serotype 1/2a]EAD3237134.1 chemotaxis protein CheV [Listeria monocytogenes CFSAN002202]EAE3702528.1 chemotaxis protein CheV [Listeria monocytogenes serotype 1/2c]EAE6022625.1 chemotaxis protein CheV [Listeria monocytogenes serotype 3a]EAF4500693.1 chemotaxis protein CheV [Listeria monocytogenes serotype 4b]EAG6255059.1 ch